MGGGMMRGADVNKAISLAEFRRRARPFDAADANRDGVVTAEERQAQRGVARQRHHRSSAIIWQDPQHQRAILPLRHCLRCGYLSAIAHRSVGPVGELFPDGRTMTDMGTRVALLIDDEPSIRNHSPNI